MQSPLTRQTFALPLLLLIGLSGPLQAGEDQDNSTPTAWQWYYGQTASQLTTVINSGYRIVDLEVESGSPARFTAALVQNTGSYAKGWWWYYNLTLSSVGNLVSQNNARIIDIEAYEVSGAVRYAVVMVPNTGADAKAWWYYVTTNLNDIVNATSSNNARIVDIEEDVLLGQTWYTAVMISNTGADAKGWYWYIGASSSFISNEIATKNLRLIDLERRSNGTYAVVLVKNTEAMSWWWYIGQTAAGLTAAINQTGSRIQSIERVDSGGTPYFYALLHNNSNSLTTTVGSILRNGNDGVVGLYLKEVNGSVRANLQENFVFEPASTIKTLMHAHAMREMLLGNANLSENLTVFTGSPNSCPTYTSPSLFGMPAVLDKMMVDSNNNHTMAIRDHFGAGAIAATAATLGMNNTQIIHTLGCGGPPANSMTLVDGGLLHEAVANGYLGSFRDTFYDIMLNSVSGYGGNRLGMIIDQEGASVGLSSFLIADFKSLMEMAYKGGSYGYGSTSLDYYYSVLAWSKIPFISGGVLSPKEFVSGVFIHHASDETTMPATMDTASAELLRDEIRAALLTWVGMSNPWTNLGGGLSGTTTMTYVGQGSLVGGTAVNSTLTNALPNKVATLVLGYTHLNAPFKGGVWGPFPDILIASIPTGPSGTIALPSEWPLGVPGGFDFYLQWWMADPGAVAGFAGSNTLRGTTP
jgi:hypothetical protein